MHDFRRIGIWQTAFLGDAVLTLPLIQAVKARFPDAEIHLFTRAGVDSLFTAQRELASVRPFAKRGAQKSLLAANRLGNELAAEGFDLWISPHKSLRSALIARAVGAPVRIGYDQPWYNWLAYTHLVARRFDELDEVERLMQLVLPLEIPPTPPKAHLDLSEAARAQAAEVFSAFPAGVPILGIHPGSTWPTKCWPVEHFAQVARTALARGVSVALFAGPGEEALAARIEQDCAGTGFLRNLAGALPLPALAASLPLLSAYLTNDSGPMHLAWVQDVPLVALFGPTVRRLGFFPRGEHSRVLETGLDCRPCGLHGHKSCPKGHHACMRDLTPDAAWQALRPLLSL